MDTKQGKKFTTLFPGGGRQGTQEEEATALNNGGAT